MKVSVGGGEAVSCCNNEFEDWQIVTNAPFTTPHPHPPQHSSHTKYVRSSHSVCAYFLIIYI